MYYVCIALLLYLVMLLFIMLGVLNLSSVLGVCVQEADLEGPRERSLLPVGSPHGLHWL